MPGTKNIVAILNMACKRCVMKYYIMVWWLAFRTEGSKTSDIAQCNPSYSFVIAYNANRNFWSNFSEFHPFRAFTHRLRSLVSYVPRLKIPLKMNSPSQRSSRFSDDISDSSKLSRAVIATYRLSWIHLYVWTLREEWARTETKWQNRRRVNMWSEIEESLKVN